MAFALIDMKCSLFEKDCLLAFISKLLGYAIVAGSTSVKIPQILKILKNRSIRGLRIVSFELDVVGYTIALAYCIHKGLPFSAFGELAFILIQGIILVAIIYCYSKPLSVRKWIMVSLYPDFKYNVLNEFQENEENWLTKFLLLRVFRYCGVAPALLTGQVTPLLFEALYASHHAIFLFAKIPQILENFSNQSTGELSFLTCLMNCAGSMVRVFTSIQEKAPTSVLVGSAIGITTNTAILSQMILYQTQQKTDRRKKSH